jgi:hypothetical protein
VIRRRRRAPSPDGDDRPRIGGSVLDHYVRSAPSAQNAVDLFRGEWSSQLPPGVGATAGEIALFDDERIRWIINRADGVEGRDVLELGPLEAAHTTMLEAAGATVTAVEANSHAFLRCLVVKELIPLRRARFLLGDFVQFMEASDRRHDLVVASGVLYHAQDPLRMLAAIARVADRVGIWTHYYHPVVTAADPHAARLFRTPPFPGTLAGAEVTLHRRDYLDALGNAGFCGGPEESAVWMELDDLVAVLRALGFSRIEATGDEHHHPNGPCVLLYAERS